MEKIKYDVEQVRSVFAANKTIDKVYITNDGNVFLPNAKSYMTAHCREMNVKNETLTLVQFNEQNPLKNADKTPANTNAVVEENAWRKFNYTDLLAHATKLELEPTTTKQQGAKALLAEIDALLNAKAENTAKDSNPANNATTNHIA